MIEGKTLVQLAEEIERQKKTKRDFIVPDGRMEMTHDHGTEFRMGFGTNGGTQSFQMNDNAHEQVATKLGIPKKYYDRMRQESGDLLRGNVNEWLQRSYKKRMVRTLDGKMRAFLSNRYRPLDNFDLCATVFPFLTKTPGLEVKSSQVTEKRMYVQVVSKDLQGEVKLGDVIRAGIVISNSEVGCGALSVERMGGEVIELKRSEWERLAV